MDVTIEVGEGEELNVMFFAGFVGITFDQIAKLDTVDQAGEVAVPAVGSRSVALCIHVSSREEAEAVSEAAGRYIAQQQQQQQHVDPATTPAQAEPKPGPSIDELQQRLREKAVADAEAAAAAMAATAAAAWQERERKVCIATAHRRRCKCCKISRLVGIEIAAAGLPQVCEAAVAEAAALRADADEKLAALGALLPDRYSAACASDGAPQKKGLRWKIICARPAQVCSWPRPRRRPIGWQRRQPSMR